MRTYAIRLAILALAASCFPATAQRQPPTPGQAIRRNFDVLNSRILEMAEDFPESKYGYHPSAGVRSFGDVIVHILSGNQFAAKAGNGGTANWDEVDPKLYKNKTEIVAALKKSIEDSKATLSKVSDDRFKETLAPWLAVIEHHAEHYGQLVAYYRANNMVPPESRPKKK